MKKFGLIGKKLGHSFSPQIHAMLGDYEYRLYELESEELIPDFIKTSDLDGFNVTIPYKQAVIPYLDEMTPAASEIGAVNTVCRRDGRLIGDNTDCVGFAYTVASSGADVRGKKTLVIGNGGASKAVCHALRAAGADVNLLTHKENTVEGIKPYLDSRIIVNTTPVGMFPKNGEAPVDISLFGECEYVFDIIFNPAKTALMLEAEKRGIPCRNGLPMLVSQAKRAAELFMECEIADSENERIIREISGKEENIVLVGMPGCGKTTVGKLIAERLGLHRYRRRDIHERQNTRGNNHRKRRSGFPPSGEQCGSRGGKEMRLCYSHRRRRCHRSRKLRPARTERTHSFYKPRYLFPRTGRQTALNRRRRTRKAFLGETSAISGICRY